MSVNRVIIVHLGRRFGSVTPGGNRVDLEFYVFAFFSRTNISRDCMIRTPLFRNYVKLSQTTLCQGFLFKFYFSFFTFFSFIFHLRVLFSKSSHVSSEMTSSHHQKLRHFSLSTKKSTGFLKFQLFCTKKQWFRGRNTSNFVRGLCPNFPLLIAPLMSESGRAVRA